MCVDLTSKKNLVIHPQVWCIHETKKNENVHKKLGVLNKCYRIWDNILGIEALCALDCIIQIPFFLRRCTVLDIYSISAFNKHIMCVIKKIFTYLCFALVLYHRYINIAIKLCFQRVIGNFRLKTCTFYNWQKSSFYL